MILSVSVGDLFIKTNDISTVEATGLEIGGIAVASLAEICLFVGSIAVTFYCVGEIIDNREEIARFGYDLINSCSETVDGWIMSFTDTTGQEYVYGTEALDLVRETEWEVIQGGLPPENNDDDDNNDNKPTKNPMQDLWNMTANEKGLMEEVDFSCYRQTFYDGLLSSSKRFEGSSFDFYGAYDYPERNNLSYSINYPIFSSQVEAEAYLKGTGAVTDALNYAKTYQIADWLSDDWAGILIDPLTNVGLSLNQLLAVAQQAGVHAIGNNLSPAELFELLKKLLTGTDLSLLPGIPAAPVVLPSPELPPIYWPNIDAHPLPGTTPGTKPDPDKDPDKEPGQEPDEDLSSYKVDLQAVFPFCIPFDFIALLRVLDAEPEAPCFDFPVVIPAIGYEETVKLDMSVFDDVAEVIRLCETVSFIIFLMFATSKVIKW